MDITNSHTSRDWLYTNEDLPNNDAKGSTEEQEQQVFLIPVQKEI